MKYDIFVSNRRVFSYLFLSSFLAYIACTTHSVWIGNTNPFLLVNETGGREEGWLEGGEEINRSPQNPQNEDRAYRGV